MLPRLGLLLWRAVIGRVRPVLATVEWYICGFLRSYYNSLPLASEVVTEAFTVAIAAFEPRDTEVLLLELLPLTYFWLTWCLSDAWPPLELAVLPFELSFF